MAASPTPRPLIHVPRHFCIPNLLNHLPGWSPKYGHPEMVAPEPWSQPLQERLLRLLSLPGGEVPLKWQTPLTPCPPKSGTVTSIPPLPCGNQDCSSFYSQVFRIWDLPKVAASSSPRSLQTWRKPPATLQSSPARPAIPSCPGLLSSPVSQVEDPQPGGFFYLHTPRP